jgi:hypothetical protein
MLQEVPASQTPCVAPHVASRQFVGACMTMQNSSASQTPCIAPHVASRQFVGACMTMQNSSASQTPDNGVCNLTHNLVLAHDLLF